MTSVTDLMACAAAARSALEFEETIRLYRLVLSQSPKNVTAAHDLGASLRDLGRFEEAEEQLWRAMLIHPNPGTEHTLAQVIMAQGKYRDAHFHRHALHRLPGAIPRYAVAKPEWRGENLAGKRLVVLPDQGIGDQLMMARFIPRLQALGADVTFVTHKAISRLIDRSFSAQILPAVGSVSVPGSHYWATSMDLPGLLDVNLTSIPGEPYLKATGKLGSGLAVGLVTSGNPKHPNDAFRSLNAADADTLTRIIGDPIKLDEKSLQVTDFADTADIVAKLDLVVTVDTSVAHLAGGMGKPVWILVPSVNTDWRWGRPGAQSSPWYPSARLFWGGSKGGWEDAFQSIRSALATFAPVKVVAS